MSRKTSAIKIEQLLSKAKALSVLENGPVRDEQISTLIEVLSQKGAIDLQKLAKSAGCPILYEPDSIKLCDYAPNGKNYPTCMKCWYLAVSNRTKSEDAKAIVLAEMLDDKECYSRLFAYEKYGYSPAEIGFLLERMGWKEGMPMNSLLESLGLEIHEEEKSDKSGNK